jgi:hypothetical protein
MQQLKKVYGHFELLKKNGENNLSKVTYSSLDKYNRSPYLHSTTPLTQKLPSSPIEDPPIAKVRPPIAP